MTAGARKHAKTCLTRGAHEHVYKGGEWSHFIDVFLDEIGPWLHVFDYSVLFIEHSLLPFLFDHVFVSFIFRWI